MVPPLSRGAVDKQNWQSFIEVIKKRYQNDDLVEIKPNYIQFKTGEHPLLPFEGHKFLRFSSKISGSHAKGVEEYIDTVTRVAKISFGSRVQRWRLSMYGAFTASQMLTTRLNPMSRYVVAYSTPLSGDSKSESAR